MKKQSDATSCMLLVDHSSFLIDRSQVENKNKNWGKCKESSWIQLVGLGKALDQSRARERGTDRYRTHCRGRDGVLNNMLDVRCVSEREE